MVEVTALPARGDVFVDERGSSRVLRLSWHDDGDLIILSLWRGETCSGSFRLLRNDVPGLIASLTTGLAETGGAPRVPPPRMPADISRQRLRRDVALPLTS